MDDTRIAKKYISKSDNARSTGVEFSLSFVSFKNMMRAKRCGYTGLILTEPRPNKPLRSTDRTIDRIDCEKGYVSGNVIAVCSSANSIKGILENPNNPIDLKLVSKMITKIDSLNKKGL